MFRARVRLTELAAVDRLCRQRGWSHADAVRSLIDPPRGHERIDRKVNGLTYMIPERFAIAALSALRSAVHEANSAVELLGATLPADAMAWRTVRGEMEEALRYFGGIASDYARLHEDKHGVDGGDDRHEDEDGNLATNRTNTPRGAPKR